MNRPSIYKSYILNSTQYKGGSTREDLSGYNQGRPLYKLSSNENLSGPSPVALEAILGTLSDLHEYKYQHDGVFREALSVFFQHQLSPDQFVTANSGLELIELIHRGFLAPGMESIISTPTFLAYKTLGELQGGKVIDIPLKPGSWCYDVRGILEAVNDNTRLIFIGSPNNPTGNFITRKQMDALVNHLPEQVIVVYDEVYYHYVDDPDYPRALEYIAQGKRVIGINSFSKAYGLAGIRLGYAFTLPSIADYLHKMRRPFLINSLSMAAGLGALTDTHHIEKTRQLNFSEMSWVTAELKKCRISFSPSSANFILMVPPIESGEFVRAMLQEGVMVRTTEVFGLSGYIRVTVGTREANRAFISALNKIVNQKNQEGR